MPKTGYVKLRALGDAVEKLELKNNKTNQESYNKALSAWLNRVHRPRSAKKKGA